MLTDYSQCRDQDFLKNFAFTPQNNFFDYLDVLVLTMKIDIEFLSILSYRLKKETLDNRIIYP